MSFNIKLVAVCAILCILAPATVGIDCYTSATEHVSGCKYCIFLSITVKVNDQSVTNNFYDCLAGLEYQGTPIDQSKVNQCFDVKVDANTEQEAYICDKDLCNAHCDGTRVGLGIIAIVVAVISTIVHH